MWIVAKALHTSPFDKYISQLTTPQLTWLLSNYYKDQEEEFEKIKILCRFINPEGARLVFDKEITGKRSATDDDAFMQEVKEHASSDISLKNIDTAFESFDKGIPVQQLDRIEVVDESKE